MVRDPAKPDPSEPDKTVELLRALARDRDTARLSLPPRRMPTGPQSDEAQRCDALRGLADRLEDQLRAPPGGKAIDARSRASSPNAPREASIPASRSRARERALDAPGPRSEFVAALPSARSLVPRLSPVRIAFVLISVAVLAVAGVGRVIGPRVATTKPGAASAPGTAPARPGEAVAPLDIPSITKAMAACDEEAARNPGSLYFQVLPLTELVRGKHDWRAVALQSVVNAYSLLSDKDALEGLRDKSLALRPDRYTFAVLDPSTGMSYSWTSATGLARLSRPDVSAPKAIKLGFDFSAQQNGPQWSAPFNREPGTCYSVNVLVVQ
jgi:hypothetical protein